MVTFDGLVQGETEEERPGPKTLQNRNWRHFPSTLPRHAPGLSRRPAAAAALCGGVSQHLRRRRLLALRAQPHAQGNKTPFLHHAVLVLKNRTLAKTGSGQA
eukprot:COSAG06_NODE_22715_length_715_cov_0.816558_1_plen_102_part_00